MITERFYLGDIVEIVTCDIGSIYEIPIGHNAYNENQGFPTKVRGQRFRIDGFGEDHRFRTPYAYMEMGGFGRICLHTPLPCLRLYRRPFKNWIKYLLNKPWNEKDKRKMSLITRIRLFIKDFNRILNNGINY